MCNCFHIGWTSRCCGQWCRGQSYSSCGRIQRHRTGNLPVFRESNHYNVTALISTKHRQTFKTCQIEL